MSAAPRMQHGLPLPLQSDFATLNLAHVLDDLCARFIVNLPADELEDMDRLCFQIEQA
jgi:mRNA-decapping enzyme subunit 2